IRFELIKFGPPSHTEVNVPTINILSQNNVTTGTTQIVLEAPGATTNEWGTQPGGGVYVPSIKKGNFRMGYKTDGEENASGFIRDGSDTIWRPFPVGAGGETAGGTSGTGTFHWPRSHPFTATKALNPVLTTSRPHFLLNGWEYPIDTVALGTVTTTEAHF